MKVLIVNAYTDTTVGKSKFEEFHNRVKEVLSCTLYYGNDHE
jgi:hypothetical protein